MRLTDTSTSLLVASLQYEIQHSHGYVIKLGNYNVDLYGALRSKETSNAGVHKLLGQTARGPNLQMDSALRAASQLAHCSAKKNNKDSLMA